MVPFVLMALAGCSDSESYSDLLRDEEHASNWWLAQHRVVPYVPSDSVFETGSDAPFYKMDEDGYVYMQVINPGNSKERPKKDDRVYFRYTRTNIKSLYEGIDTPPTGNADDLGQVSSTSVIFDNYTLTSTSKYGEGIQIPLYYLGYDSEVNLVIRSYMGFADDRAVCNPYLVNVRYFKAEY